MGAVQTCYGLVQGSSCPCKNVFEQTLLKMHAYGRQCAEFRAECLSLFCTECMAFVVHGLSRPSDHDEG